MKNRMDSRNRDAKEILADLDALGKERCRLVIVGSHKLDPSDTAAALREQWPAIVELVGFEPRRVITGCAPGGAEKAARLAAKDVTGKLAVVFHRPLFSPSGHMTTPKIAEMFMNILLSRSGDAALILGSGPKPTCTNLRAQLAEWSKRHHQVEVG